MTALAVVLACAALAFAYAAWERAGVTARWAGSKAADDAAKVRVDALFGAMRDHGQALQDVRAELARMEREP